MMASLTPKVNVSSKGEVPVILQVFRIRLPCSGHMSAEIPMSLRLNVTAPPATKYNDTILVFKRNKFCFKGVQAPPRNDSVRLEPGPLVNGAGAFYVAATCSCALLLVVGSIASALYIRNSKARIQESQPAIFENFLFQIPLLFNFPFGAVSRPRKVFCGHRSSTLRAFLVPVHLRSISPISVLLGHPLGLILYADWGNPGWTVYSWLMEDSPTRRRDTIRHRRPPHTTHFSINSGYRTVCPFRNTLPCCSYSAADTGGLARSSVLVRVDPRPGSANSGSYATIADLEPLYARPCGSRASYYASSHVTHLSQTTDPCEKARALSVSRAALYCCNLVQEGTFGRVYKGTLELADREQEVIIKTVTEVASTYQASLLVVEGSQLAGLVHTNITSLTAACLDSSCPLLAYASAPGELNLKLYLTDGNHHPVTRDLVHVGAQVARAGAFLHGRGLLHRDIATRNCLIEPSNLRVRLADTALARDLFPQDYHCLGDNENRPIRWMALETLQHNQYSTATDVWSFGVFLWELVTMGQQPYIEVDPFEMMACLRDGYRLAQPRPCPDELFAVMAVCWLGLPRDRPTMPQLLAYLQDFHDALGGFI
ncbi:Tyrosine-protein kinase RYK [Habropoda laboriosa]|uniref:Tyrosine-protein kinase RYK n=1 Tax=Habropoda laboriosa TaxID=597456 RepID=A0A0L7QP27_9HYME|nr:Tyrosine-protein kinase RYK [Habropoda laboriosa]